MSANASVHNSCAPEAYPQPNCENVASFFGLPIGLLLAATPASTLSLLRFCLLARTVALLLGCHRGLLSEIPPWEQPMLGLGLLLRLRLRLRLRLPSAVGQGAGRGGPLTVHDRQRPGKSSFHRPRTIP